MADKDRSEALDAKLERLFNGEPMPEGAQDPLLTIAGALRERLTQQQPAPEFRARLKAELLERYANNVREFPAARPLITPPLHARRMARGKQGIAALLASAATAAAVLVGYGILQHHDQTPASRLAQVVHRPTATASATVTPQPTVLRPLPGNGGNPETLVPPAGGPPRSPRPTPTPPRSGTVVAQVAPGEVTPVTQRNVPPPPTSARPTRIATARPTMPHATAIQPTLVAQVLPTTVPKSPTPPATATPIAPTATRQPTATPVPTATVAQIRDAGAPTSTAPAPTATITHVVENARPTATSTPRPSATPPPTSTPLPTKTPEPSATATPSPTKTPIPQPSATPSRRATATATPTGTAAATATPSPIAKQATSTPAPSATVPAPTPQPMATFAPLPTLVAQVAATSTPAQGAVAANQGQPSATPVPGPSLPRPVPANAGSASPLSGTTVLAPGLHLRVAGTLPGDPGLLPVIVPTVQDVAAAQVLQSYGFVPLAANGAASTDGITATVRVDGLPYTATLLAESYGYQLTLHLQATSSVPTPTPVPVLNVTAAAANFLHVHKLDSNLQGGVAQTIAGTTLVTFTTSLGDAYPVTNAGATFTYTAGGVLQQASIVIVADAAAPVVSGLTGNAALTDVAQGMGVVSAAPGVTVDSSSTILNATILYVPVTSGAATYLEPVYRLNGSTAAGQPFVIYTPAINPVYFR